MEIGTNSLDVEPTQEELQKIRHWLASGFSRDRIEFLQSITEFHLRYLDALKQQPLTKNANKGDNDSQQKSNVSPISTSSLSGNEEINLQEKTNKEDNNSYSRKTKRSKSHSKIIEQALEVPNVQQTEPNSDSSKEKSKLKSFKSIRPSHKHIMNTRSNNRYEVSYGKEDSSFKSKSVCLKLNHVNKPKLKAKEKHLQRKEHTARAANSNLKSVSVINSNMVISEIFPTIVPINLNLGKVKIETDYVPIVGVKTEPRTGIGSDAVVNYASPADPVGKNGGENQITMNSELLSESQTIEKEQIPVIDAVQIDEDTPAPVRESIEAAHENLQLDPVSELASSAPAPTFGLITADSEVATACLPVGASSSLLLPGPLPKSRMQLVTDLHGKYKCSYCCSLYTTRNDSFRCAKGHTELLVQCPRCGEFVKVGIEASKHLHEHRGSGKNAKRCCVVCSFTATQMNQHAYSHVVKGDEIKWRACTKTIFL